MVSFAVQKLLSLIRTDLFIFIYNSFTDPVLRPNVSTLSFFKVANATLIFLLIDYNVHYILWREAKS